MQFLADVNDRLRAGDEALSIIREYLFGKGLDGGNIAIVNTDGQYRYVGRLVLEFNPMGKT